MKKRKLFSFCVEEQFIQSKTGRLDTCEDLIHIGENFVAVIDGTTSKTDEKWNQRTGGQLAAKTINECFEQMPPHYSALQAAHLFTSEIDKLYKSLNVFESVKKGTTQRFTAALVALSMPRGEVWLIGDCQYRLKNEIFKRPKRADEVLANVRALFLETELLRGATMEELLKDERGHQFVRFLLERQTIFQNNLSAGEYWYPAVDGFPIPPKGISVRKIPKDVPDLVLATDGYPILRRNLKETETSLEQLLRRDPLLFREYKSTKGMLTGNVSFDDRAFVRLRLRR